MQTPTGIVAPMLRRSSLYTSACRSLGAVATRGGQALPDCQAKPDLRCGNDKKFFLRVFVVNKIDKQASLLNQILRYQADLGNFKLAQQGKNINDALILNGCITLNNDRQGWINGFILL